MKKTFDRPGFVPFRKQGLLTGFVLIELLLAILVVTVIAAIIFCVLKK